MSATIKDVAKKAGVSHTTVSMVIHEDVRITPETKKRVMKAIEELHYHPNVLARSLVKGKTNSIAIIANFFSMPFEVNIMKGIEQESEGSEYNINQYATRTKEATRKEIFENILYGRSADAVIALSKKPEKDIMGEFKKNNIPVILIEQDMKDAHMLKADSFKGAYMATEYLIKKGRKKIGIIVGATSWQEIGESPGERLAGYKKALEDYGIKYNDKNVIQIRGFYFEEGVRSLRKFIDEKRKLDAVFSAAGDMVAFGVIKEANIRKISIPEDLAVVGFDDIETASLVSPALTTVRQPMIEMGKKAFRLAVDSLEGKVKSPEKLVYEPKLIVRGSA